MTEKILSSKLLLVIAAVVLAAVITTPVLASPATATRTLPATVTTGVVFDVIIETSDCGAFGQVVETLPNGFTYLSCSSGDIGVEQTGNAVKFTFLGDSASFTYTVMAPAVADTYTFTGIVKDGDLNQFPVTGDTTIIVSAREPLGSRDLPASVLSEADFNVAIEASDCGAFGQVVETLPNGFTYLSCSSGDIGVEQTGNAVKFTFLGDSASFTYSVTAPIVDTTTTYTFQGTVEDEDRVSYPLEDDDITVLAIYTLTIVCAPPEGGAVALDPEDQDPAIPDAQYGDGTIVTLRANPAAGYNFDHWSGSITGSAPTTSVTMTSDLSVTAHFAEDAGPPAIGGEGYFPSVAGLLAPWIALMAAFIGGVAWFVLRRRNA